MQISVDPRHRTSLAALLKIQYRTLEQTGNLLTATHQQLGISQAQAPDHAGVLLPRDPQLSAGRRAQYHFLGLLHGWLCRRRRLACAQQRIHRLLGMAGAGLHRSATQLLQLATALQGLADLGYQLFVAERLADIVTDAGLNGLNHVVAVAATGDHDEGGLLLTGLRPQPLEQLQTAEFRHFPVTENQVECHAPEHLSGLAAVYRLFDLQPGKMTAQRLLDQVADEGCIIHHQNGHICHGTSLDRSGLKLSPDRWQKPSIARRRFYSLPVSALRNS